MVIEEKGLTTTEQSHGIGSKIKGAFTNLKQKLKGNDTDEFENREKTVYKESKL